MGTPNPPASTDLLAPTDPSVATVNPEDQIAALEEERQKEQNLLLDVIREHERPEQPRREIQVRQWRKCEYYWKGLQDIVWDDVIGDWRPSQDYQQDNPDLDLDQFSSDKSFNVYKAHGESIISALTASLPKIRYFPKNAEEDSDITTAKAYSKLGKMVEDANTAILLFIKALKLMYTQGLIGFYNFYQTDPEYGVYKVPVFGKKQITIQEEICPNCGGILDDLEEGQEEGDFGEVQAQTPPPVDPMMQSSDAGMGSPLPDQIPPEIPPQTPGMMSGMTKICPNCDSEVIPEVESYDEEVPFVESWEELPKGREVIEVFGPLNIKIPAYANDPKDLPYVILESEEHFSKIRSLYPELRDKIVPRDTGAQDRATRIALLYEGFTNTGLVTMKIVWLRPWALEVLGKGREEDLANLKQKYPSGIRCVFANDELLECIDEDMDAHWTFSQNPLSNGIHSAGIGDSGLPIQDARNDTINLMLQKIKYGVPQNFADPNVLDFNKYKEVENVPGIVIPATAKSGQSLQDGFYTFQATKFSKDEADFLQILDSDNQFLLGDYPSIFGGTMEGGSKTLGEYQQSRSQALQRLGTAWKILMVAWPQVMKKAVTEFKDNLREDEQYVEQIGDSYVSVWIRMSELTGQIGKAEAEISDQFPLTWDSKRAAILELLQMNKPQFDAVAFDPNNATLMSSIVGVPELKWPGAADREKQLREIGLLIKGQPMMVMVPDPMTGMAVPQMQPSVPIEPEMDNHQLHIMTIMDWSTSLVAMDMKDNNPMAYQNVVAHMQQHQMIMQQQMAAQAAQAAQANGGEEKPPQPPQEGNQNG